MDSNRSTRDNTWAEAIRRHIDARLLDVHTSIAAQVVRWDPGQQQVDCQILIKEAYLDEEGERQVESLPIVTGCAVEFMRVAGAFTLTCPISDGHLVIDGATIPATTGRLVFLERSHDKWFAGQGQEVDPEIDHTHGLMDAVFVPGLHSFGNAISNFPNDHMTLGSENGVRVHFRGQLITVGDEAGSDFVALAMKTQANFDTLFNLLSGLVSSAIIATAPPASDAFYTALLAAINTATTAGSWPAAQVASTQAKAK